MSDRLKLLSLVALMAVPLLLFSGLGAYDLSAPDEPRFALVAREMIQDQHWLLPHRNGNPYPDKPPLLFWSIAAVSLLQGGEVNTFSARLPSVLAALGLLLLMFRWARDEEDSPLLPWIYVLVLASCYRFFFSAHMVQIDMLLCMCVTASMVTGWRALQGLDYKPALLGLFLGLGILAKGPVGYLVPVGAWCLYCFLSPKGTWSRFPGKALLWGLLPPLTWIAALLVEVALTNQWDYLNNLLFKQTVTRALNPWHHYQPFWYFGRVTLTDLMPWSLFLVAALPLTRKRREALSPKARFAWSMVLFTLFFFSLSKGKRDLYILPMFPFAAYLVASYIKNMIGLLPLRRLDQLVWTGLGTLFTLVGIALAAATAGLFHDKLPEGSAEHFPTLRVGLFAAAIIVGGVTLLVSGLRQRHFTAFLATVKIMVLLNALLYFVLLPYVSPYRSARRFMQEANQIIAEKAGPEPVVAMVFYRSAYRFYGNYPLVELCTLNGEPDASLPDFKTFAEKYPQGMLIIRRPHWEELGPPPGYQVYYELPVGRGTDFMLVGPKKP